MTPLSSARLVSEGPARLEAPIAIPAAPATRMVARRPAANGSGFRMAEPRENRGRPAPFERATGHRAHERDLRLHGKRGTQYKVPAATMSTSRPGRQSEIRPLHVIGSSAAAGINLDGGRVDAVSVRIETAEHAGLVEPHIWRNASQGRL